jgi:signal transduction histidine kinase
MGGMAMSGMTDGMLADLDVAYRRALSSSLAWAAGASVLATAGVGLFVTRRIVALLRAMTRASARIAGGTYQDRLNAAAPGEVGDLADAFNTMAATLERTEAQRVQLLSDVSHEFRTPLSNLKGYVEGLEEGVFEPDSETLAACGRQVARLERLVDDLALLSRIETGQLDLHPERISVAVILEDAAASFRARFAQKGVALELQGPGADTAVHADPTRVAQIVANLLSNALRYTPDGGHVTLSGRRDGSREVLFEVRDDGEGIPADRLTRIFERFYRGDSSRRHDGDSGSGIGLTLVKQLVERQGGRVGADSRPGAGTRIWFTLPRSDGGESGV